MIQVDLQERHVAKQLASEHSDTQARFLNELGRWLSTLCKTDAGIDKFESQCALLVDDLDDSGRRLITTLALMITAEDK